jgi:hypothetical protein
MGIQRSSGGNGAVFFRINAKEGCLQHNQLDEHGKSAKGPDGKNIVIKEPPMTRLEGTVVGISVEKDEYQGEVNYRVRVGMLDTEPGAPKIFVDFPFGSEANGASFFGMALMGKLNAADLTKPVTLMPWIIEAGNEYNGQVSQSAKTGVTVYQGGQKLVEDFGGGAQRLPERKKTVIRGKEQVDPADTSWDEIAQKLFESLKGKVTAGAGEKASEGEADDGGIDVNEAAGAVNAASQAARPRFGAQQSA